MSMRWLALWLFLTAAWAAGWAVSQAVSGGAWRLTGETAGHLIAIPLAQVIALWGVSKFRRMFRQPPPASPSPGGEDRPPASRSPPESGSSGEPSPPGRGGLRR